MKRIALLSTAAFVATLSTASVASAETKPAMVWIPTADVDLIPSGTPDTICEKSSMSADIAAAGCVGGLAEAGTRTPNADTQAVVDGAIAALEAYDVTIVTEPPPSYVPIFAVLTSGEDSEESLSYTCSGAGLTCAARGRDSVGFTNTGTMNCTDPDLLQSALYTVGRMSGLEGKEDPRDVMSYPPNYEEAVTDFIDECGPIANFLGGDKGMTELPVECTSADHAGDCEAESQNSHADMLDYFGPATEDTAAPEIGFENIADGDVIAEGTALSVSAKISDDSTYAAVRITIASDALDGVDGITGGEISFCTTDICDVNFLDGDPFKLAESEWATGDINGLPGGEYTITLEAADYHGNVAETLTAVVTLEGGGATTDGGGDTDGDGSGDDTNGTGDTNGSSDTNDSGFVTDSNGDDSGEDGGDTDGDDSAGATDDGGGCAVGAAQRAGSSALMMLGLLGLGFIRRRN